MLSHPGKSELLQNYDYIFRDWVWGEDENRKSTELISSILPGGYSPKRVLVLGSGAGRLAYDLNKLFQPDSVTLVDRNPLLMMVAKSLISGESLNLVEFPYLPSSLEGIGIDHTITGVLDNSSNFQFVLADIKDFDFAQNQYDLIVTPWLIDVLDMDFPRFSAWLSEHLESSALWINYGPLGFNSHKLKHCYSFEEARHIVQKAGFLFENESLERVEYMKSPYSLSSRVETVFTFSARKQNEVRFDFRGPEVEPSIETLGMGNFYPTLNYSFSDGHKLSAFVFEALESHRLLSEIIDEVVTKFHLSKLEAKMVVDEALQTAISEMERNPLR
jgi:SAM-dependent methyltransferase